MGRGPTTPLTTRRAILQSHQEGKSCRQIARELHVAKSVVHDIITTHATTGSLLPRQSTGRPSITTRRENQVLRRVIKSRRHATTAEVTKEWSERIDKNVSSDTCRRRIHDLGYSFYRAKEKPLLTALQKKKRLSWGKRHRIWTLAQWKKVVYSDESKFTCCYGDHRNTVIRTSDEAFHPHCLKRTVKYPDSLMVWGCMSSNGTGRLHFIDGTVNAVKYQEILQESLLPSLQELHPEGDAIFQEDGAPAHTAKTTKKWLQDRHITKLEWPSSSPDMSPIENLWGIMKRQVRKRKPRTKSELKVVLQQVWDGITPQQCSQLTDTLPARILALIDAKGDVTKY